MCYYYREVSVYKLILYILYLLKVTWSQIMLKKDLDFQQEFKLSFCFIQLGAHNVTNYSVDAFLLKFLIPLEMCFTNSLFNLRG